MAKNNIHPHAKKNNYNNEIKDSKKNQGFNSKFSWLVIAVFAISTFVTLGLIFDEFKPKVGFAEDNLAGYNSWKTQYGLNATDNDAYWNKSGDGISNYTKFKLNLDPRNNLDQSIISVASTTTTISIPSSTNLKTPELTSSSTTGPAVSLNSSDTSTPAAPVIPSTPTASQTSTATNSSSSSLSSSTPTANTSTANSTNTANITAGSGATQISKTELNGVKNTSGTSIDSNSVVKKNVTDRTGGEVNIFLFAVGIISLISGAYILQIKFQKNSLAVNQGEF